MKKILFCLITLGVFYADGTAQSQGSISVGGAFNLWFQNPKTEYTNQTVDGTKTTQFTLLPSVEYFVSDQFSLGLGIGYNLIRYKSANNDIDRTGMFYFEPYVRKYFKLGDRFSIFGQGGLSLGFGNRVVETTNNNTTVSTKFARSSVSVGITPGILFFVSDKVALETSFGSFGYEGSSTEVAANQKDKTSDFGLQLNTTTLNFGIRFFIK